MKCILQILKRLICGVSLVLFSSGLVSCSSVSSNSNVTINGGALAYFLPQAWILVEIYEEATVVERKKFHVKVQSLAVADTSKEYQIKLDHSMATTDRLRVEIDRVGLLKRITYNQRQRGTDSAVALGKAAVQVGSMMMGVPIKGLGDPPEFSRLILRRVYKVNDNGTLEGVEGEACGEIAFCVSSTDVGAVSEPSGVCCTNSASSAFFYRPMRPIKVSVKQVNSNRSEREIPVDFAGILYVPDSRVCRGYELLKGAVGESSFDFSFTDGTLTEVSMIQESGLYEVVSVPGRILGVVTGLPAKLISIDVNRTEAEPKTFGDDDKDVPRIRPRLDKD